MKKYSIYAPFYIFLWNWWGSQNKKHRTLLEDFLGFWAGLGTKANATIVKPLTMLIDGSQSCLINWFVDEEVPVQWVSKGREWVSHTPQLSIIQSESKVFHSSPICYWLHDTFLKYGFIESVGGSRRYVPWGDQEA